MRLWWSSAIRELLRFSAAAISAGITLDCGLVPRSVIGASPAVWLYPYWNLSSANEAPGAVGGATMTRIFKSNRRRKREYAHCQVDVDRGHLGARSWAVGLDGARPTR
jgi:hypothetical protein